MFLLLKIIICVLALKWVSGQFQQYPQYQIVPTPTVIVGEPEISNQLVAQPSNAIEGMYQYDDPNVPNRGSVVRFTSELNTLQDTRKHWINTQNNLYITEADNKLHEDLIWNVHVNHQLQQSIQGKPPSIIGNCKIVNGPPRKCSERLLANITILVEPYSNPYNKHQWRSYKSVVGGSLQFNCRTVEDLRPCIPDPTVTTEKINKPAEKNDIMVVNLIVSNDGKLLRPQQKMTISGKNIVNLIVASNTSKTPSLRTGERIRQKSLLVGAPPSLKGYNNYNPVVTDILDEIFHGKIKVNKLSVGGGFGGIRHAYAVMGSKTGATTVKPLPITPINTDIPVIKAPISKGVKPATFYRSPVPHKTTTSKPQNTTAKNKRNLDDGVSDSEIGVRTTNEDGYGTSENVLPTIGIQPITEAAGDPRVEAIDFNSEMRQERILLRNGPKSEGSRLLGKDRKSQKKLIVAVALAQP